MTERADGRRVGEIVGGKYRVVRLLASGGMGVVYEAQHTVVKRRFAVKFLRPHLTEQRESLARFQREAQTAGALESENLTAAVDFGIGTDGSPYIVMEYLVGESLQALLTREGRLSLGRAADLVVQACRGIHAAHASGIVHRDLKPQNLFVCRREDGTDLLKVLDFGIAKLEAVDKGNTATRTGTVLGTPAYMSPEQARGEKTIDHGADVYALGAILYELLSGQKPHPGSSHNAILHHIATQPAVPLQVETHALPAPLVALVMRTLAAEPGERPVSAEAFAQELAPFAKREVWPAPKVDESTPRNEIPLSGGRTPNTAVLRGPVGRAAAVSVAVAAVAAALLFVNHRASDAEATRREASSVSLPPIQSSAAAPAPAAVPPPAETVAEPSTPSVRPDESRVAGEASVSPVASAVSTSPAVSALAERSAPPSRVPPAGSSSKAAAAASRTTASGTATSVPFGRSRSVTVSFDQQNPYQ